MSAAKLKLGVVGLGFGANFLPIFKAHPDAELYAICRRDPAGLRELADRYQVPMPCASYEDMLALPELDAVLIMSPVGEHYRMTRLAFRAGKHVACTVPMAGTVEECRELASLKKKTGRVYMMFETAVYTRTFLYVKELADSGRLGKLQFLRGSHQQNMSMPGWPDYWYGYPPMLYATHALSPLLALAGRPVESVVCHGSGAIRDEYAGRYGSPFAVETAHLKLADSDLVCEVTRSLFDTIRQFRESFDVYASKLSFEWEQLAGEGPVLFSGLEEAERVKIPDYGSRLPESLRAFTGGQVHDAAHASSVQGGGHGGSYPHLVHEFVSAVLQGRPSAVDADAAANWSMVGMLAHESAMRGGERMRVPQARI